MDVACFLCQNLVIYLAICTVLKLSTCFTNCTRTVRILFCQCVIFCVWCVGLNRKLSNSNNNSSNKSTAELFAKFTVITLTAVFRLLFWLLLCSRSFFRFRFFKTWAPVSVPSTQPQPGSCSQCGGGGAGEGDTLTLVCPAHWQNDCPLPAAVIGRDPLGMLVDYNL